MRTLSILAVTCGLTASAALAGTILITDSPEGSLTVTASGTVAGQSSAVANVSCSVTAQAEVCDFQVVGPTSAASASTDFFKVNMFEPDGVTVSDTLFQVNVATLPTTTYQFKSDIDGVALTSLPPGAGLLSLIENGSAQSVVTITYHNVDGAAIGTDVVQIQSDLEGVPEPSTWLLALSGLALLCVPAIRSRILVL